jgi:hypothetical protein
LTYFTDAGYTKDTIFKVVNLAEEWHGREVKLHRDDTTSCPFMELVYPASGERDETRYLYLPGLFTYQDVDDLEVVVNAPQETTDSTKAATETPISVSLPNAMGGIKFDQDKEDWTLLPLQPIKAIVEILMIGAKKYAPDNWQKVEKDRYVKATWRHWTAWCAGEKDDPETGKSHLAHIGCNILFLLWFELNGK